MGRHLRLVTQPLLDPLQQGPAAGEHDPAVHDVGGELGRGAIERLLHRVDDLRDRLLDCETTIPPSEIPATSLVPPPMSTTIEPVGSPTGRPAPIAAAIGSSIRYACRAPALRQASSTARFSTPVTPLGTQTTTRGWANRFWWTFWMKWRSISSVTSKSAITPSFSGRMAEIVPGVRPSIRLASMPTAWTSPLRESTATTLGSDSTIPRPRT